MTISHSESLEHLQYVGVADWTTLSAMLQGDRHPKATRLPAKAVVGIEAAH